MNSEDPIHHEVKSDVTRHKHSKVITAFRTMDGEFHLFYNTKNLQPDEDECIEIRFFALVRDTPAPQKEQVLRIILKWLRSHSISWIDPGDETWNFDLDLLREEFEDLQELDWCVGKASIKPEFQVMKEARDLTGNEFYETSLVFYINPGELNMRPLSIPPEIQDSLRDFHSEYPDPSKVAFIIMRFGSTRAHDNIVEGIKKSLEPLGITAVRADDKEWHADLYYNILTYLYGCGFAIAVFERIEREDFNPNVSLEVGYMLALGKPVCLLKDKTLSALQTDLVGKLYRPFDPQEAAESIPRELSRWLADKKLD